VQGWQLSRLVQGIADALDRGWNAVTFDGPGQNAALVRQQLTFRPDWGKVITPVVDHLLRLCRVPDLHSNSGRVIRGH